MVMADIHSGHINMPHQFHHHRHHHYHEGFLQPTLVENENHQMDFKFPQGIKMEPKKSQCVGCSREIQDQYILRVAPDLEWHAACLKCQECNQFLDESCTCFVREGKTYCKRDYVRLFGTKCDKCGCSFSKNDFVMRAKTKIYHIKCFRCTACEKQLKPGDEFALRDGGTLYCKIDHDQIEKLKSEVKPSCQLTELNNNSKNDCVTNDNNQNINNQTPIKQTLCNIKRSSSSDFGSISDSDSESDSYKSSNRREKQTHTLNGKPARVRTVLNEKQLSMLRACYAMNSRPDSLVKEQLVEMTGLSPRVVRVWFQNKRCKDKKKAIEAKLQMQQEKEGKISFMHGIPLIASPPVKHESPINYQGYEVTKYQPPWKVFSEFAMQNDSENDTRTSTPAFQHLVNQLHGYDLGDDVIMNNYSDHHLDWHKNRDSTDSYQESEESVAGSL
ncbi:unnamed protein product [Chironomus riparius]|uniref:Insulin gene enhancer protein ISL-1 n=1 Tax=Chironomus riparius TaxID=315576 RepID=A0A9N9RKW6_9DIPT|nr:unnamed protein product [Chironomus riparius]